MEYASAATGVKALVSLSEVFCFVMKRPVDLIFRYGNTKDDICGILSAFTGLVDVIFITFI